MISLCATNLATAIEHLGYQFFVLRVTSAIDSSMKTLSLFIYASL